MSRNLGDTTVHEMSHQHWDGKPSQTSVPENYVLIDASAKDFGKYNIKGCLEHAKNAPKEERYLHADGIAHFIVGKSTTPGKAVQH